MWGIWGGLEMDVHMTTVARKISVVGCAAVLWCDDAERGVKKSRGNSELTERGSHLHHILERKIVMHAKMKIIFPFSFCIPYIHATYIYSFSFFSSFLYSRIFPFFFRKYVHNIFISNFSCVRMWTSVRENIIIIFPKK